MAATKKSKTESQEEQQQQDERADAGVVIRTSYGDNRPKVTRYNGFEYDREA